MSFPRAVAPSKKTDHLLHFYPDEAALGAVVAEFLGEGLRQEDTVLVVATAAHLERFRAELRARGTEPEGDRFRTLDAGAVLAELIVAGVPDRSRFDRIVGGALQAAAARGAPVRIYGEMVDLLWQHGNATAAVELEELWNDLLRKAQDATLLCAYSLASVYGTEGDASRIQALHDCLHPGEGERERELSHVTRMEGVLREALRAERDARSRTELLYRLTAAVNAAASPEAVFSAALDAIGGALSTDRAAILAYAPDGVMRFRAWRGLSDEYRAAVEGHSPWPRDARQPGIVSVDDAHADDSLAAYRPLFLREKIGALHFIPLVAAGQLVGKFMVYYPASRALGAAERELAAGIAAHVAEAIVRFGALDDLRQSVKFHEMFTGILSHDLRNPLSAIVSATQLALQRTEDPAVAKPLTRVLSSSGRMTRLIDQLLDLTRIRMSGGLPLRPRPGVDLQPLLRQVIEELDAANAGWALRFDHRGDGTGAWDPDRLSQLFSNLIANAGQHGTSGTPIEVSLDGTAAGTLVVTVHNAGAVPASKLPTLFEPLARGESSAGLGLGLYIAREIVRAHRGTITLDSDEARGTTFRISLPRSGGATSSEGVS